MATQMFQGRGQLIDRLAAQVGNRGMAIGILKKRGDLTSSGEFTSKGRERNAMTAEERAMDRASKESGRPMDDFVYSPAKNSTKLKSSPVKQAVKDACYKKVKATYKVFPSAYASGAIAKCRKNKGKK